MSYLVKADINEEDGTIPLIDNLEITEVFKDKGEEEEVSVIDLIR